MNGVPDTHDSSRRGWPQCETASKNQEDPEGIDQGVRVVKTIQYLQPPTPHTHTQKHTETHTHTHTDPHTETHKMFVLECPRCHSLFSGWLHLVSGPTLKHGLLHGCGEGEQ